MQAPNHPQQKFFRKLKQFVLFIIESLFKNSNANFYSLLKLLRTILVSKKYQLLKWTPLATSRTLLPSTARWLLKPSRMILLCTRSMLMSRLHLDSLSVITIFNSVISRCLELSNSLIKPFKPGLMPRISASALLPVKWLPTIALKIFLMWLLRDGTATSPPIRTSKFICKTFA